MKEQILWKDRPRTLGLPLSFTRYRLSRDRIFRQEGIFGYREEEIELYRVQDLQLQAGLFQRLFGVGTIVVLSTDRTTPRMVIRNVARPRQVKELIHRCAEEAKQRHFQALGRVGVPRQEIP